MVLAFINSSTQYVVSLAVLVAVLRTGLSPRACYDVAGAIVSSAICKALKRVLNHARPDGAAKEDPGMPSSHANSLSFLATTAALHLQPGYGRWTVVALGALLSWLRVHVGYHTAAQVLVGFALGTSTALVWGTAAERTLSWVLGTSGAYGSWMLRGIAVLAMAAFGLANVPSWLRNRERKRH